MSTAYAEQLGALFADIDRRIDEVAARPSMRVGTVTAVDGGTGNLTIDVPGVGVLPDVPAISPHVREVGRQLLIHDNGGEPVVVVADLIAARTILAGMIVAGTITANEITALLRLLVGQAIESTVFTDGPDGVGFHIGSDRVVFNSDVVIRGLLSQLPGRNILPNGSFDQGIAGWTAQAGSSIAYDTTPANTDGTPGALSHTTAASATEQYVESDLVPIDRLAPYLAKIRCKPAGATDQCRLGIRYYDATAAFISEVFSLLTTTGVVAYSSVEDYAEPPSGTSGETTYYPASDYYAPGGAPAGNPNNTAGQKYQNIDEAGAVNTADFVQNGNPFSSDYYAVGLTIASGDMTGKTPTSLKCRYWVAKFDGTKGGGFQPFLRIGSTNYNHPGGALPITGTVQSFEVVWAANPATGNPWTAAELEAFRSGGTSGVGGQMTGDFFNGNTVRWYKAEATAEWTAANPPTQARLRLYTKPASAVARTTKWDTAEVRPQPAQYGGLSKTKRVETDALKVGGFDTTAAMTKLATVVLPSGGADFGTITIPQTCSNLMLVIAARGSVQASLRARLNGDSSAAYFSMEAAADSAFIATYGGYAAANGITGPEGGGANLGGIGPTDGAGQPCTFRVYMPSYRSTVLKKNIRSEFEWWNLGSAHETGFFGSLYDKTPVAATTSLLVYPDAGTLLAGSELHVYGLA